MGRPHMCESDLNDTLKRGAAMETKMIEDSLDYFRRRAREERERAETATDSCARKAHARIAAEYERRAQYQAAPTPTPVIG